MNATIDHIQQKYQRLKSYLGERQRRLWAGAEALALGRGGISRVASATGLSRMTVRAGARELTAGAGQALPPDRVRRPGSGRPPRTATDPTLLADLDALVEPATRGDPESPLRWTCKSTANLAAALKAKGHKVSPRKVAQLLRHDLGYSLQATSKTHEGKQHKDRNAQFEYVNARTADFQARGQPVVSVDAKKKELVGNFQQQGQEWQPEGEPAEVNVYDFPDPMLGKALPYGVYDPVANAGWVSVGTDHDTAEFATETIRRWWQQMGQPTYPAANELLVVADGGGSNGRRNRLWKVSLQRLADELGLAVGICHLPPGTSKWNKIEHRLFSEISKNWRGRPLVSHEVVVNLIGVTKTESGLRVQAELDTAEYPTGIKVSDEEFQALSLHPAAFHGEWNYTIRPRKKS